MHTTAAKHSRTSLLLSCAQCFMSTYSFSMHSRGESACHTGWLVTWLLTAHWAESWTESRGRMLSCLTVGTMLWHVCFVYDVHACHS